MSAAFTAEREATLLIQTGKEENRVPFALKRNKIIEIYSVHRCIQWKEL
jgi:hypothetical protein